MTSSDHTYNLVETAYQAAKAGDWKKAIDFALGEDGIADPKVFGKIDRLGSNYEKWNVLKKMPQFGMPDDAVNRVLDHIERESSTGSLGVRGPAHQNFLHELSQNLYDNKGDARPYSADTLSRAWRHSDPNAMEREEFEGHPSFALSAEEKGLSEVASFWRNYELKVGPEHFATVRSLHTGQDEEITDHRGNTGSSEEYMHLHPSFEKYAQLCQASLMEDEQKALKERGRAAFTPEDPRIRYFAGQPHVQVFRGVGGDYAQKIRSAAGLDLNTGTVQKRVLGLNKAPLSSWSLSHEVAERFTHREIDGQADDQGVILKKWMPVKDLLHSGFHTVVPGQKHAHEHELELVFRHRDEKMKLPTSCIVQHQHQGSAEPCNCGGAKSGQHPDALAHLYYGQASELDDHHGDCKLATSWFSKMVPTKVGKPKPLNKGEDEVERMLEHPDRIERRLALKLAGVTPRHLSHAIESEDEHLNLAALKHPALNHQNLLKLADNPNKAHLWGIAAKHPLLDAEHLQRMVEHAGADPRTRQYAAEAVLASDKRTSEHARALLAQGVSPELQLHLIRHAAKNQLPKLGDQPVLTKAEPAFSVDLEGWLVSSGLKKAEDSNLLGGLEPNSEILKDMHGFQPHLEAVFGAVRFLVGGPEASLEAVRRALWDSDGDLYAAALKTYGVEANDENLRAVMAVLAVDDTKKSEKDAPIPATATVAAGAGDGEATAAAVRRALASGQVMGVQLGGRHSKGSVVARDPESKKNFLLKPGSGPQSPAAGARESASSQSQREAAFWHVARLWGIDRDFPRCDLLLIGSKQYACMHLLPWNYKPMQKMRDKDRNEPSRDLEPYRQRGDLHRWAVVDFVLGNPDRHAQNVMVNEDGDVKLIDHGSAFAGKNFDPSFDKDSFIPYYLRYACPDDVNMNSLRPPEKLRHMQSCPSGALEGLRRWVDGLHVEDLQHVLPQYGIDPTPEVERLARVKSAVGPLDQAINQLWIGT